MTHKHVEWDKVERMYKSGSVTLPAMAKIFGVNEGTIRYHAKKHGWTRDLQHDVHMRTRTKLAENTATVFKDAEAKLQQMTDEYIIEEAARTVVEVVRQHQHTLKSGHNLTMRMLDELEAVTTYQGELKAMIKETEAPNKREISKRAITLQARAQTMGALASAAAQWIKLERQAFNIIDESKSGQPAAVDTRTVEEIERDIQNLENKIGRDKMHVDLDPEGVANKVH